MRITPVHPLSPTKARGPSGHRELADVTLERRAFELVVVESETELNRIEYSEMTANHQVGRLIKT